jgi:uncharacterized oligopeptide transporter (OPT) family protein
MAVPMRRQMIDIDRLKFPSGTACAETIRSMHRSAGEAVAKARALMWGALFAALFELPYQIAAVTTRSGKVLIRNPLDWWHEHIKIPALTIGGKSLYAHTLALPTSTLMYGAGAIMGIRVGLSLMVGAVVLYGMIAPWLASHGVIIISDNPALTYRSVLGWAVWPGVMAALAASLFHFAWKWRSLAQAFGSIGKLARSSSKAKASPMAAVEVPATWFGWGMIACTAYVAAAALVIFDISIWMSVVAVLLSFVLAIVACRATGETDVTPIGPLGKITQLTYAALRPGHYGTNLMTASITAGAASHSADLLTDLKTGYLLGGSPRRQFIAQFFGILAGAVFCVPAYLLVARPEKIGTADLPAPAAQTWAVVADLLANGVESADRGDGQGTAATLQSVGLSRRPPGVVPGDMLAVLDGPNAGAYTILAVGRKSLVLDRDLPVVKAETAGAAEIRAPDGKIRGGDKISIAAEVTLAPAIKFISKPEGTKIGDYVRADQGREMYYRVDGVRGDTVMLEHAFPEGAAPTTVRVIKSTLPPYAATATLIGILFGILIAVLEIKAPGSVKAFLPSVTGLGIGWLITGWDSLAMGIGAIIAYILLKAAPKIEERYNVAASSGIIAGASIMGLIIIFLRDILGVLAGK